MFICDSCKQSIGPRIPPIFKVIETRKVEYDGGVDPEDGMENPPTIGFETVREVKLCAGCHSSSLDS